MNKFQDLVTKKKSELVEMADFNSASQLKKAKLIKKLSDDADDYSKSILSLPAKKSGEVKEKAGELGIEYTTKGETISKIAENVKQANEQEKEARSSSSWKAELNKAIDIAIRNVLDDKRSYKVIEKDRETNLFNVSPKYMKHDKDDKVLVTIDITHYAKSTL